MNTDDVRARAKRFSERDSLIILLLADISDKLDGLLVAMSNDEGDEVGN